MACQRVFLANDAAGTCVLIATVDEIYKSCSLISFFPI